MYVDACPKLETVMKCVSGARLSCTSSSSVMFIHMSVIPVIVLRLSLTRDFVTHVSYNKLCQIKNLFMENAILYTLLLKLIGFQ